VTPISLERPTFLWMTPVPLYRIFEWMVGVVEKLDSKKVKG